MRRRPKAGSCELYDSAVKQATDDERALAGDFLMRWMNGRRD